MGHNLLKKRVSYYFGIIAELSVIVSLVFSGYIILKWRYKTKVGEIDIIAKKKDVIFFIEVKARSKETLIEECISKYQVNRIRNTAMTFLKTKKSFQNHECNFILFIVNKFLMHNKVDMI